MIKKYSQKNLDPQKWDELVKNSSQGLFYCLFDILTALHSQWEFFVWQEGEEFQWGTALPVKKAFGFKRVVQPAFCQQLGIMGNFDGKDADVMEQVIGLSKGIITWAYHLNENNHLSALVHKRFRVLQKRNLVLNLNQPFEERERSYSNNLKRKIKKAHGSGLKLEEQTLDVFWPIYSKEYSALPHTGGDGAVENLRKALKSSSESLFRKLYLVHSQDGVPLAGGIFIGFNKRLTYWSGFSNPLGKDLGAMAFLMNSVIRAHESDFLEFDFETGNLEGTRRFFGQFRPDERPFQVIRHTPKLPFVDTKDKVEKQ